MRVALYARVSKDDGKQDTENQLHELRDFCKRSGWTLQHEYIDRVSGSKSDRRRRQLRQMFEDASKRRFDVLLFWRLDRFSREGTLATLQYLERLSNYGIAWRSYQEPFLDTTNPFGEMLVSVVAHFAKHERICISERTKAGLKRARREGKVLGRPRVEVDVNKVRKLQDGGMGLRGIAERTGWSLSSIMRSLKRSGKRLENLRTT